VILACGKTLQERHLAKRQERVAIKSEETQIASCRTTKELEFIAD
jgi:hypothetical protein